MPFSRAPNFGLPTFTSGGRPRFDDDLVDAEGRAVWKRLTVYADELRNGVTSWPGKDDAPGM